MPQTDTPSAKNDPDDLPDFLDRKKTLSPEEYAAQLAKAKAATTRANKKEEPRMPAPAESPAPSPAAAQKEARKEKSRVRIENLKAKQSGETSKQPLTGRAALALIKADPQEKSTMRTQIQTEAKKLPVPPPAAGKLARIAAKAPKAPGKPAKAIKTKAQPKTPKTKAKPAKAAPKGKAKPSKAGEPRKGSKLEEIVRLLGRANGCTSKEVLEATGWPSVSMPQQAEAAGIKLRKEKVPGEPTRYYAK